MPIKRYLVAAPIVTAILAGGLAVSGPGAAQAQSASPAEDKAKGAPLHEPARGSAERKAILDALRVPVSRMLKGPVAFEVRHLKVQRFKAFLIGVPRRPDGTAIDYAGTKWAGMVRRQAFKDRIVALLRGRGTRWRVIWFEIGSQEPPWADWPRRYNAPEAIFPEIPERSPLD